MSGHFDEIYHNSGQYLIEESYWAPTEYEDYYVCDKGYVLGKKGKILKQHNGDDHGHLNVRIFENGEIHEEYIHRLVAKAFCPNPNNYPYVRHLDDDPTNNDWENLEWGTQKDNYEDSVRNNTYRPFTNEDREKSYAMSRKPIIAKNLNTNEELIFPSENDAARRLNVSQSNINGVLYGKRRHSKNWMFRFIGGSE